MKQQILKWVGAIVILATVGIYWGLEQVQGYSLHADLKFVRHATVTAQGINTMNLDLERPMGVAAKGDILAVADAGKQKVIILNTENKKRTEIIQAGDLGRFSYPVDLVFGPKGLLYVADLYKGRVFAFDLNGKLHKIYPSTAPEEEVAAISPTALAFDNKGNLYVTDVGRQRVAVFDPAGRFLFSFGQEGTGKGELLFPNGIAVDTASNKVYVADTNNSRIQVFNGKGKFETVFPLPEGIRLSAPRGLTITGKRDLLFVDTLANQIYFINLKSRKTNVVALNAGMAFPNDITGNGRKFFVADRGNKRLISFTINSGEVKKHAE